MNSNICGMNWTVYVLPIGFVCVHGAVVLPWWSALACASCWEHPQNQNPGGLCRLVSFTELQYLCEEHSTFNTSVIYEILLYYINSLFTNHFTLICQQSKHFVQNIFPKTFLIIMEISEKKSRPTDWMSDINSKTFTS